MADLKGLKRICMSCGARFYDLNKKPIICPSCKTEFTGEIKVKSRRGRLPSEAAESQIEDDDAPVLETETDDIEQDEETVSLEEIEEDGDDAEDDLEIDGDIELDDEDLDDIDDEDIDEDIAEDDDK